MNNKKLINIALKLAISLLAMVIISKLIFIIKPIIIGIIFFLLINPLIEKITIFKIPRFLITIIVYIIIIAIVGFLIIKSLPQLYFIIDDNFNLIIKFIKQIETYLNFNEIISNYIGNFQFDLKLLIFITKNILSGLLISFYLIIEYPVIIKYFNYNNYLTKTSNIIKNFFKGTMILSMIVFIVCFISFTLLKLNNPFVLALICALTNVIPYIGPYVGGILPVINGYNIDPQIGVFVLLIIVILQFIEGNILNPLIMSKTMHLNPLTIIISLLVFSHFFGIIGIMMAIPLATIIKLIFNDLNQKYQFIEKR